MRPPIAQMTKKEILWLHNHRCNHGHTFLSHYSCYLKEKSIKEKVGFLDIETSNLKANFGIVFSWCIKPAGSMKIQSSVITRKELASPTGDKRLIRDCIEAMNKYDRIVGHFGCYFDIPYLRTRAIMHKLHFPRYGDIVYTDTWKMAKRTLCIHSNRQNTIAEALFGKTIKTRLNSKYWLLALQGDKKSLDYILKHNKADVIELERNYNAMLKYTRKSSTSI